MKTYKNLYPEIYNLSSLILAWRKARKGKTKKFYVIEFEKNIIKNLLKLHEELKNETYFPKELKTFILRDPKTRKIKKADFRDRIVHHALVRVIEPVLDKTFIYDSCANRIGKGNLFALKRFIKFIKTVSENGDKIKNFYNNNSVFGYCFKADIKHYFQEVSHEILIKIIKRKINDKRVINLIRKILENGKENKRINSQPDLQNSIFNNGKSNCSGMPLGNLTSQFFANVYLNELDYFVKHKLKAK